MPASFTAATRNVYGEPFVKPVTVAVVVADTESVNTVHDPPLSDDHCTR